MQNNNNDCLSLRTDALARRNLILVSNRGPFTFQTGENGQLTFQRGGGGLVTALLGLANQIPSTWVACAMSNEDRSWDEGDLPVAEGGSAPIHMKFINPSSEAYESYYGVISNPLLWFLQHSMWDFVYTPTINRDTWKAWEEGYVAVNRQFGEAVAAQVKESRQPAMVMMQDYHLYLAPRVIRQQLRRRPGTLLTHFVHIPWPGPEDWSQLPEGMRQSILDGLCAVDLLGFQTMGDSLNFIRCCESLLPGAKVNYRSSRVTLRNHVTHVRDFPISIDPQAVRDQAFSTEAEAYYEMLKEQFQSRRLIVRIDRSEPSKNIVRGFQAYDEMLEAHPEHIGKVQFLAVLVPSRLEVEEYQDYLNQLMAAAGSVNAKYGTSEWEPIRVLVGESYPRALAAMRLYDVLLVNPVADGMNLVAKEGPLVNEKDGVLVLSERAGAHQQLGEHALVIAPCDVSATAEALHRGLVMAQDERRHRARALAERIEREDIELWLCWQLAAVQALVRDKGKEIERV